MLLGFCLPGGRSAKANRTLDEMSKTPVLTCLRGVLRSTKTFFVSPQGKSTRVDLGFAARQQIRKHTSRTARHGPAERAVTGVEMEVGIACCTDHRRTVGRHRPPSAPERGLRRIAAAREQVGQRMIER